MKPSEFTTLLFGAAPPHLIHTWRLRDKRSFYYRSPHGTDIHGGGQDVYVGVSLARKDYGPSRRTPSTEAVGIAGMWLDVDSEKVEYGVFDAGAIALPTIVVWSGHGWHLWWLFDEPWMFKDKIEQHDAAVAATQWQALHRMKYPALDSTADLARLMRLPGTYNAKDPEHPEAVIVLRDNGPRYPRAEVLARAREAGPVHVQLGAERAAGELGGRPPTSGAVRAGGTLDAERLHLLLDTSPEFTVLWNHERGEKHWSLSEYDMALTNLMAAAGWTDQQLADLITTHRARYGETAKARRPDYLRRTIAKAREHTEREDLMQRIRDRDTRRAA